MRRTVFDCALTGAIGILTGFAVFILTWEERSSVSQFLGILMLVAIFAAVFEYVRDEIEGSEHRVSLSQTVIRLFLLAIFELFITAVHTAASFDKTQFAEVGTAALGPTLAAQTDAVVNLVLMGVLWIVIGAAVGGTLALTIWSVDDKPLRGLRPGAIGLAAGAFGAPAAVFCYVIATRFVAEMRWMFARPDEWAQNVQNLHDRVNWNIWEWPVKLGAGLVLRVYSWVHGPLGLALACAALVVVFGLAVVVIADSNDDDSAYYYLWAAAAPIAIFGAPLVGPSIYDDFRRLGELLLLVGVVWGLPSLLIGLAVPYLREPSRNRRTWAGVAWLAAAFLVVFAYLVQSAWIAVFAVILFAAALAFWRNIAIEDYWPLLALSVATIVLGATKITVYANFLHIHEISQVLLDEPLSKVAPPEPKNPFGFLRESPLLHTWRVSPLVPPVMERPFIVLPSSQEIAAWRRDAAAEDDKARSLLTDADALHARLQSQASGEEAEKAKLAGLHVRDLPEVARDTEDTEAAIVLATTARTHLNDEIKALQGVADREPFFSFLRPFAVALDRQRLDADSKSLTEAAGRLSDDASSLRAVAQNLQDRLKVLKDELAQRFELCLTGSFGFWVTLGLLAGWARKRGAEGRVGQGEPQDGSAAQTPTRMKNETNAAISSTGPG